MVDMALPLHEVAQRQLEVDSKILTPDFRRNIPESDAVLPPWKLALDLFLNNGNAAYVKNWVEANIEEISLSQRVIFLDTLERRADFFFEMLTSLRQVELSAIVNDFLSRDWD